MSLSSALGTKDVSASECSPLEHYYVKSKNDVSVGTYGVYVSNTGDVNETFLPQSVILNISTPSTAKVFDFTITAADMLNLGHVADIKISEQGEIQAVYTGSSNIGGGSGRVSNSGSSVSIQEYTGADYIYEIQSKLKQATLGILSNANISLTDAINFNNTVAFYESSTSGGGSILTSGVFYFTSEALSSLKTDNFYVLSVNGGDDIDANDDGILDATPTLNLGSIHAVVNEKTLKNENFKVNILTEVAFQLTKELMNDELNTTLLQEKLDDIATRLLKDDVNGDEKIDYEDILAWQPIHDKDKLLKPYNSFYEAIVQKIYKNEDIYDDVYALAYTPYITNRTFTVDENASVGTIIGQVHLDFFNGNANFYSNNDNTSVVTRSLKKHSSSRTFRANTISISVDGTLSVTNSGLDYENAKEYPFNVMAEANGEYFYAELNISINNVLELPILEDFNASIGENPSALQTVGQIPIKSSDGIYKIVLEGEGSELFTVDILGEIRVADGASFNYDIKNSYMLSAYAINSLGKSKRVNVSINILK